MGDFTPSVREHSLGRRWREVLLARRPPVDATGNSTVDSVTSVSFATAAECIADGFQPANIVHGLNASARSYETMADRISREVAPDLHSIRIHRQIASILRGWATDFAAASSQAQGGGDAA